MIIQERIRALQDILDTTISAQFDLPRIVVLGSQSSGKSSVLEQILKKDFLPRGSSLVTRCPVVISLKKTEASLCLVDGKAVDPLDMSKAIKRAMDRNCGSSKGIVDRPIHVQLHTGNTLDMVLVDLPGLTKIPIGDQPADIEHQILQMIRRYIASENTLILCVVAANTDIATAESLKIAKEVDPNYERTICCLTKIDLMDQGTDCCDVLDNTHPRLRHGYVGIINRSQKDISDGLPASTALEKERAWFRAHSTYTKYGEAIGSEYLLRKLGDIFQTIFERELPAISAVLRDTIGSLKQELSHLEGQNSAEGLLAIYATGLKDITNTAVRDSAIGVWCQNIRAHQSHISFDDFDRLIEKSQYLLLPEKAFEKKVLGVSKQVFEELLQLCARSFDGLLQALNGLECPGSPQTIAYLNVLVSGRLREQFQELREELVRQQELQTGYVDFSHPEFDREAIIEQKIFERVEKISQSWESTEEPLFSYAFVKSLTIELVFNYTDIVVRNAKDAATKLVQLKISQFVRTKLLSEIASFDKGSNLITSSPEDTRAMDDLRKDIQQLTSALARLGVPEKQAC